MHISPDCKCLRPLLEKSAPTTLKAQKRVGMFSYYGKFIDNFSEKVCVLNHNFKFPLLERVLKVFQSLRHSIKDATLIAIDQNKDFQVETDASDFCLVATLSLLHSSHEHFVKLNVIMSWRRKQQQLWQERVRDICAGGTTWWWFRPTTCIPDYIWQIGIGN